VGVKFSTNGSRITPEIAARLAASDYVDVQISLDGATAGVNDRVRGVGSYATAVRAMERLSDAGFEGFKVSVVVTRENVGQLDAFKAIADRYGVKPENVVMGSGSTQILTSAVQMFTSTSKPLVSGIPSYEEAMDYAERIGTPVRAIPLDANMKLDLNAMADASKGAGMVFVNNPNNPTATLWSGDAIAAFIDKVLKNSPDAIILLDEAYHDYVTDPTHRTQIPLAVKNPRVVVARTFSKAHGMAGMRIGYGIGHADTIKKIASWEGGSFLNVPGLIAAAVSIKDQARLQAEAARNTEARKYTIDWFKERGFESTDSQCNFIFVNVKRPAREFREACRKEGVLIARDFPPYEKTHVRISIGSLDEMKSATETFARALAAAPAKAA